MIRVETKDVLEVFRVNGMTEFAEHVATLERERDEARAAYLALRDSVQKLYVAGNCEKHGEDDWWWCDCLAGINGKEGMLGFHPDKPEWRK